MTYVRDLIPELIVELYKSLIKLLKEYLGKSHHKIIIKFIWINNWHKYPVNIIKFKKWYAFDLLDNKAYDKSMIFKRV